MRICRTLATLLLLSTPVHAGGFETAEGHIGCTTLSKFEELVTAATNDDTRGVAHAMETGCQRIPAGVEASLVRESRVGGWIRLRVYTDPPVELYSFRRALVDASDD